MAHEKLIQEGRYGGSGVPDPRKLLSTLFEHLPRVGINRHAHRNLSRGLPAFISFHRRTGAKTEVEDKTYLAILYYSIMKRMLHLPLPMPSPAPETPCLIAVIGDLHGRIPEALERLRAIEERLGPLACLLCVGDVGLLTEAEDWRSYAVPRSERKPEITPAIAEAWKAWPWPLAMIGGNHDAYGRLRRFRPESWGGKLSYTNAGLLSHPIEGLRVYGLSGIYSSLQYSAGYGGPAQSGGAAPDSWEALMDQQRNINPKRLTYYKKDEIEHMLSLPKHPHILLTHDWPIRAPVHNLDEQPHFQLLPALEPAWAFAGHLHHYHETKVGPSRFIGLADITGSDAEWCVVLRWDGEELERH